MVIDWQRSLPLPKRRPKSSICLGISLHEPHARALQQLPPEARHIFYRSPTEAAGETRLLFHGHAHRLLGKVRRGGFLAIPPTPHTFHVRVPCQANACVTCRHMPAAYVPGFSPNAAALSTPVVHAASGPIEERNRFWSLPNVQRIGCSACFGTDLRLFRAPGKGQRQACGMRHQRTTGSVPAPNIIIITRGSRTVPYSSQMPLY